MNRSILTVCVCLAVSLSAFGQSNQGTGYLFELPGPSSTSGQFYYSAGTASSFPASATGVAGGPVGLFQIVPRPDGGQFYLVSPGNLQASNSAFTSPIAVSGLDQPPSAVTVTPDGKHALAATDQFYIIDSTTSLIAAQLPLPAAPNFSSDQPSGTAPCPSCWIAVSADSSTAYVLTNGPSATVTEFNLNTHAKVNSLSLQYADTTGITISPLGLLYVTGRNVIYEINPATLTLTPTPGGTIPVNLWAARLKFTPDGTLALAVNYTPATGGESLIELTLANYGVSYWPAFNAILNPYIPSILSPTFSDILVAGNSKAFALSTANPNATLYDVSLNPFNASVSVIGATAGIAVNDVNSAAISNELPNAQFLYLLTNQNVLRINLGTTSAAASQATPIPSGKLEFALVPPQTGAASFLQFNNKQTPVGGATSAPLIARVLNAAGQPIFNLPVTFAADANSAAAGLVVKTPSATTNADGYVQTTVTAPTAPGNYNVILTAGTVTSTFSLTVACSGTSCSSGTGTGTGSGTGSSQVTIVSGNGQLLSASFPETLFPLTIKVTDTSGNPLAGVPVTFSSSTGFVTVPSTATDQNGLASTFYGAQLTTSAPFQADIINAATQYGQVNFTVTEVQAPSNVTPVLIQPINLINPNDITNSFTVPEGTVLSNAFEAIVNSDIGTSAPIPGVGVDILGPDQATPSTVASCQGSPVSDATGTVICNIVATCQTSGVTLPQSFPVYFDVGGGYLEYRGTITLTSGTASKLNKVSGDSQHGVPGQTLPLPLAVTVTDGCGSPASGANVTWTVSPTNGVTLSHTTTVTNSQGSVSTDVTMGQTAGTITVTAAFGTSTVVFTLTNQVVVSGVSLASGGSQTALAGAAFAQPVVFLAHDANNNPVAGATVNFSASNGATLNPGSGITNAQGMVSTTVTAGNALGSVVVTATLGSFSATATLTVQAPGPSITASSFVNSASGAVGLVACGLGSVFGNGIAPNVQGVVSGLNPIGPLPYTLDGFSMTINSIPVPIQALANQNGQQQANFQTPCEVQPGTATVVVTANGETVTVTGVQVLAAQPGMYPSPVQGAAGITYGAVISATDGSLVTLTNPAHLGQNYYLIATGLGQVTPAAQTDSVGIAGQMVNAQVVVGVNNAGVPVISAQYAQGAIGAYLVEFQIPANAPTGTNQNLALAVVSTATNQLVFGNTLVLPAVEQ